MAFALQFVNEIRQKDPGIGGKKLWYMYHNKFSHAGMLGRDRFEAMIDNYGLKVRVKKRRPRTTDSTHGLRVYPNIVKDFIPNAPNQLWVSDITYLELELAPGITDFCYLSMILDAYTEEIIGYKVAPTLEAKYPVEALKMALARLSGKDKSSINLIHHSDRGVQYACSEYVTLLKENNIKISMTECGNPKDNAMAERINNTMKNELLKGMTFRCLEDAELAVEQATDFYNNERPHMSINMMTPVQAALCTGELPKQWLSYRERAIKEKLAYKNITEKSLPLPPNPTSLQVNLVQV